MRKFVQTVTDINYLYFELKRQKSNKPHDRFEISEPFYLITLSPVIFLFSDIPRKQHVSPPFSFSSTTLSLSHSHTHTHTFSHTITITYYRSLSHSLFHTLVTPARHLDYCLIDSLNGNCCFFLLLCSKDHLPLLCS